MRNSAAVKRRRFRGGWLLLAIILGTILTCGCDETEPIQVTHVQEEDERLGFYLKADIRRRYNQPDSAAILVVCGRYPSVIPTVEINESASRPWGRMDGGIAWGSEPLPLGIEIGYRVTWTGDTLMGSLVVPSVVDTVYVGGDTVRSGRLYGARGVEIDSGCNIRWKAVAGAVCYHLQMETTLRDTLASETIHRAVDTLVWTPDFHLPIAYDTLVLSGAEVTLTTRNKLPIEGNRVEPHVETERMFCYEDVATEPFEMSVRVYWY
jgi:hypothetical protein